MALAVLTFQDRRKSDLPGEVLWGVTTVLPDKAMIGFSGVTTGKGAVCKRTLGYSGDIQGNQAIYSVGRGSQYTVLATENPKAAVIGVRSNSTTNEKWFLYRSDSGKLKPISVNKGKIVGAHLEKGFVLLVDQGILYCGKLVEKDFGIRTGSFNSLVPVGRKTEISINMDGTVVALCDPEAGIEGFIHLVRLMDGYSLTGFRGQRGKFSLKHPYRITYQVNDKILFYDLKTKSHEQVFHLPNREVFEVVSPCEKWILTRRIGVDIRRALPEVVFFRIWDFTKDKCVDSWAAGWGVSNAVWLDTSIPAQ